MCGICLSYVVGTADVPTKGDATRNTFLPSDSDELFQFRRRMSAKIQFFTGLVVGLGGSFVALQQISDRRLLAFPKPEEEKDLAAFRYETMLYRRMWESKPYPTTESEIQKQARVGWNSVIDGVRSGINAGAEFVASAFGK
jgi:hypothetical protein